MNDDAPGGSRGHPATAGAGFNRPYGTDTDGAIARSGVPTGRAPHFLAIPTTGKPKPNTSHQDTKAQRHTAGFVPLCENALRPGVRILEFHTAHTKTLRHKGTPLALCLCVRTLCVLVLEFLNFTRLTPRHQGTKTYPASFVALCLCVRTLCVLVLEFLNFTRLTPRHQGTKTCPASFVALCLCVRTLCGLGVLAVY